MPQRPMLIPIHGLPFPESTGGCDEHVSTGLRREINPVGSLGGEKAARVAETPMMSVPFCALPCPPSPKIEKSKRFADRFYRVILVIGMGSEIIGRLAPRSSLIRTEIIAKYRDHRWLSTGSRLSPQSQRQTLQQHAKARRSSVAAAADWPESAHMRKGLEIIGQLVSLVAISLLETANVAIMAHQTHRSGLRWLPTPPSTAGRPHRRWSGRAPQKVVDDPQAHS